MLRRMFSVFLSTFPPSILLLSLPSGTGECGEFVLSALLRRPACLPNLTPALAEARGPRKQISHVVIPARIALLFSPPMHSPPLPPILPIYAVSPLSLNWLEFEDESSESDMAVITLAGQAR